MRGRQACSIRRRGWGVRRTWWAPAMRLCASPGGGRRWPRVTTTSRWPIAAHPACRMGDVGKAFGVTLPAVTHLIDRLEDKGFVTRADDPVDRRAYVLEVTRAGGALVDELQAMRLRGLEAVLARMSADDRASVVRGLEALVEASVEIAER